MRKLGVLNTINHLTILAVTMILKAITTVIALVDTMESITVNKIPQDVCYKMQVIVLDWPMRSKEERKQIINILSRV